jgi:DNA-binding transcriptional LysR family regulator
MKNLDLNSLRLFVAVCEAQQITKAARSEHIVGSAISKRLAQLEEVVGTTLLVRKRSGIAPTAAGEILLKHAKTMLATAAEIERDMASHTQVIEGNVKLVTAPTAIAESLPDAIASFLRDPLHRSVRVEIEERVSHEVASEVRSGAAAIGICWDVVDLTGLETRFYAADQLGIAVAQSHPLANRSEIRFEETRPYEHIGMPPSSAFQAALDHEASASGQQINYRVVVSTFDAAIRVARSDLGLAVAPREIVEQYIGPGGPCFVPLSDGWAQRRFVICFKQLATLSVAARSLLDYLALLK